MRMLMKMTWWKAFALIGTLACLFTTFAAAQKNSNRNRFYDEDRIAPTFDGHAIVLTPQNFDEVRLKWHYLFVNFYADWCPYCRRLKPVWNQASTAMNGLEDAAMATVDCVAHSKLAMRFSVSKFPTMRLFRSGKISKKEYRSARTAKAITEYFKNEINPKSMHAQTVVELDRMTEEGDKRIIVGFFASDSLSKKRQQFQRIADHMRDDCRLVEVHNEATMKSYGVEDGSILYKTDKDHALDEFYVEKSNSENELRRWAYEKCVPLVQEATHSNIEALTEEGKPFFILFYDDQADDGSSVRIFKQAIESRFQDERDTFKFLYADGNVFHFPLEHMGLSKKDMPVVVIDSFKTMYQFGNFNCFGVPEKVKQFVDDFKDGTLHKKMVDGQYAPYECNDELERLVLIKSTLENRLEDLKEDPESANTKAVVELEHMNIIAESHTEEKKEKEKLKEQQEKHGQAPLDADLESEINNRVHDSVFAKIKPGAGSTRYSMRDEL